MDTNQETPGKSTRPTTVLTQTPHRVFSVCLPSVRAAFVVGPLPLPTQTQRRQRRALLSDDRQRKTRPAGRASEKPAAQVGPERQRGENTRKRQSPTNCTNCTNASCRPGTLTGRFPFHPSVTPTPTNPAN